MAGLLDILQGANRGFVTGLLGAPVDLANTLLGGIGGAEPFLGSRYIGDKLAAAGLLPKQGNKVAEFVGGLLGPGEPFKVAAALPAIAKTGRIAELTREFTPGDTTGHLPELLDNPELQRAYADLLEPLFTGASGEDRIATALGAKAGKTLPNAGYYEGRVAPGFASQIAVDTAGGELSPSSKAMMDAIAGTHGLLATQKQSAYNVLTDAAPNADAFALQFVNGAPFTGQRMRDFQQAVQGVDSGIVPMVDPAGARALVFGADPQASAARFAPIAQQYGASATPRAFTGNLFPSTDEYGTAPTKFSMAPYVDAIEAGGPDVQARWQRNVAPMAAPLLEQVSTFAQKNGLTQAPWFAPAMRAIAEGGLPKLKSLIKAGVVPAGVLVIGSSAVPQPQQ